MTENLKKLIDGITGMMDSKMPKEQLDALTSLKTMAENIDKDFDSKDKELQSLKNDYIDMVRNGGGSVKYDGQDEPNQQGKSFEQCVKEVLKNK